MARHKKTHHSRRRNADEIPDDILLTPGPLLSPQATQSFLPYSMPAARPRPSRTRRAANIVGRKAVAMVDAIKPQAATINKDHLLGVGANGAGALVTAIAANELVDNFGAMPTAIGAAVFGGLGSAFLQGHWQRAAQGMLGAGVGQIGTAYLTERALKKASTAQKALAAAMPANQNAPAAAAGGKRNAYGSGLDADELMHAIDRTERRLDAMLDDDSRNGNGYGDGGPDAESRIAVNSLSPWSAR